MIDVEELARKSAVKKLEFRTQLLTPLFTHGWQKTQQVNGKTRNTPIAAETRVPSLRGVLRYWWRAVQNENDANRLLEEESKIFGGSSGTSGNKSPVAFKMTNLSSKNQISLRPHRNETSVLAIPANAQTIVVEMMYTPLQKAPTMDYYRAVMELFFCLGSMGQRSRRGTGALQYEGFRWNSVADFQASLRNVLSDLGVKEQFEFPGVQGEGLVLSLAANRHAYSRPRLINVWVGKNYNTAEDVREAISRAASTHNGGKNKMLGSAVGGRLASPLWCTVRKIGNGYRPVISELASPNMGRNDYLSVRNQFLEDLGVKRP